MLRPAELLADPQALAWLRERALAPDMSRYRLVREACEHFDWLDPRGRPKEMACRKALGVLASCGLIELPAAHPLPAFESVPIEALWHRLMQAHPLGVVPSWGPDAKERERHLEHIVCNSRFLILPSVRVPHPASHVLARVCRRLPEDWRAGSRSASPRAVAGRTVTTAVGLGAQGVCSGRARALSAAARHHDRRRFLRPLDGEQSPGLPDLGPYQGRSSFLRQPQGHPANPVGGPLPQQPRALPTRAGRAGRV